MAAILSDEFKQDAVLSAQTSGLTMRLIWGFAARQGIAQQWLERGAFDPEQMA